MKPCVWLCAVLVVWTGRAMAQMGAVTQPQVTLELGTLRGFYEETHGGRKIASFKGIPYVKQPMGRHRFKDSIEMSPWLGVYNATRASPACQQYPPPLYSGPVTGNEDCLYINVYTPFVPSGTVARPLLDVVVYIHGGAFMFYTSNAISPKYLLDRDLVLVTFNYRLGPLGFLTTGDATVPGNAGMKDQVMALRWVQRYISSFGGDPNKVTLAGHSAGGASVHLHLLSQLSKGLFHKAIVSSGSALNPWANADTLKEKTLELAANLGCAFLDSHLLVKCLRSRSAHHIVSFSEELQFWNGNPMAPWAPSLEPVNKSIIQTPPGAPQPFLTEDPLNVITSGKASDVPILFSFTSHEGGYPSAAYVFDDAQRAELSKKWDELIPHILDFANTADPATASQISQQIKQHYLNGVNIADRSAIQPILQMVGDRMYVAGIAESSLLHAQTYTSPVYALKYSYKADRANLAWICKCSDTFDGANHYDDAALMLDTLYYSSSSALDNEVQTRLIDLWYSFITTEKPQYGGVALPEVKTGLPSLKFIDVGLDGNPTIQTETDTGHRSFWRSLPINENNFLPTQSLESTHTEL